MSKNDDEVLVRVEGVSKKFCRSLKKSLWYGVCDIAGELLPGRKRRETRDEGQELSDRSAQDSSRSPLDAGLSTAAASALDSGPSTLDSSCSAKALDSRPSPLDSTHGLRAGEFFAVKDVSFELRRGECLGLIGHNGAGKTTLLKMLNGLIKPDAGSITMRGRVGALIALGAGFNPILAGRENIYINGSVLGLTKKEIDAKIDEIIDFAEIREFIDMPVQSYSSGMTVRLGFAVATALDPDVLIVDEVLAVGDYRFKWKCIERIKHLKNKGTTIILVSHNSQDLLRTCQSGLFMSGGELRYLGNIDEAIHHYEIYKPNNNNLISLNKSGPKIIQSKISYLEGAGVSLIFRIQSNEKIDKSRVIISLFHSSIGALFGVSSYRDLGWISLKKGITEISVYFNGFKMQSGTCSCDITLRGSNNSIIYDIIQGVNQTRICEVDQNFEGFGINGAIVPKIKWIIKS